MGQRYGLLPSEILTRASTFDLVVMDMAMSYEKYLYEKDKKGYVPQVPLEELQKLKENFDANKGKV